MSFKLLLLQLSLTRSAAADKLRFIHSDSPCLRAFNRSFPLFFLFFCFYFRKQKSADTCKKYPFCCLLWSDPIETSRRNTTSHHRDNIHVYDK